jgi:SAM-dependent methyltransferase
MTTKATSKDFFEAKYRESRDPWAFCSNNYEQNRYSATLRALNHRRYRNAFEPGCSIGILTARLASICDHVNAIDISPTAVERAREFCEHLPNVTIRYGSLANDFPAGVFDLIVLSEIGYYFDQEELFQLGSRLSQRLETSGVLLAVHWLGHATDHVLEGDLVHETLGRLNGLSLDLSERHAGFRIDRWVRS